MSVPPHRTPEERAAKRVEDYTALMWHVAAYVIVNAFLWIIVPQAAPWVTGATDPHVPVHVIARDPAVLEPFRAWGFRAGAFPEPTDAPPRMDAFRGWFVDAFSGGPEAAPSPPSREGPG